MKQGIVIIHNELHNKWFEWLCGTNISIVGIHAAGGPKSTEYLEELLDFVKSEKGREYIEKFRRLGMQIEYEYHAMSYLLPRKLFAANADYFRMDEHGKRNPDVNLCPSNAEALSVVSKRAAMLADTLKCDTGKYFIWQDDDGKCSKCECGKCKDLSISDQVLIMMNAVLRGLRTVDPNAKCSYLAYFETLSLPVKVKADDGIFLEFAPFRRVFDTPLYGNNEKNAEEIKNLPNLLEFFGKEDACALDYWIDNSLQSSFKRPPKKLNFQKEVCLADIKYYTGLGIDKITTFAGYCDEEYMESHGVPPIRDYAECIIK